MASQLAASDPELSAQLQWLWKASGQPGGSAFDMMTGFQRFLLNPDLPANRPPWGSEINRDFILLNHGYGTPDEHYLFIGSFPISAGLPLDPLVAWYGYGAPLSVQFGQGTSSPYSKSAPLKSR